MSLRARVVALIGLVLVISMLLGALSAGYQVRQALHAELTAGLSGARQTVASSFEDLPTSNHSTRDLHQLISTFDGNRHVRATLVAANGRANWISRSPMAGRRPPGWFQNLLGPPPRPILLPVPPVAVDFKAIALTPTADADMGEAWREFLDVGLVISVSAAVGLFLVYLVIGAAFRPLTILADQFARISTGDYRGRLAENGPSELLKLQRGFNLMASELAVTTARNDLLTNQMATIQEEERADIARDLHDEIGPQLFAVNLDAQMIVELADGSLRSEVMDHVRAIQTAVTHVQRQVRDLLSRLRPTNITELGLNPAIEDLASFWAGRRPEISFELKLLDDEGRVPEGIKDILYRIIQEATNNSVRHANPKNIRISLQNTGDETLVITVVDDGENSDPSTRGSGMGLIGMGERIAMAGGSLTFGPNADGAGWTTLAEMNFTPSAPREMQSEMRL